MPMPTTNVMAFLKNLEADRDEMTRTIEFLKSQTFQILFRQAADGRSEEIDRYFFRIS